LKSDHAGRLSENLINDYDLSFTKTARSARFVFIDETTQTFSLELVDPILHSAGRIAQQSSNFWGGHALRNK